ncbi:hypothetical protein [Alteriqipengyuania lutimaris]|uniref:LPXTG cell wall anchor domain-containing protein n=1 Tax=Alteriqipengyuania lutimaris TaxID=1538146 RepID=A0A395LKQ3_9SPHN|nr:hypothetical protein [Alteriqipengyuania lutimaris]MBB3033368.1 hypothetical protein [Alteriqipengyuania lutimaris]RDS77606.1 hypothetical protein DL238_08305 [Alteriqipengyuania lutimaris]
MRLPLLSVALLLGAVGASAQPVTDFRLPPDPEATPAPDSEVEGPTDLEGDRFSSPRIIATPTASPTPRATRTGTPSPAASPRATPSAPPSPTASDRSLPASDRSVSTREMLGGSGQPSRNASQTAGTAPGAAADRNATEAATSADDTGAQTGTGTAETGPSDAAQPDTQPLPSSSTADETTIREAEAVEQTEGGLPWLWLAGALAALLALAGAIAMRMRRKTSRAHSAPSALSAPPSHEATSGTPAPQPDAGSLEVEAHAVTLNRSVMNASISYRLSLVNRGRAPIDLIEVQGDVTTAHGRVPAEQQLADTSQVLPELHTVSRLDPGQRTVLQGELRLPLREVRAIRQGSVPVFVPLLRLTLRAANLDPRAYTYVIGTRNPQKGSRPTPFRLDEPPRSYAQLTTRALA